MEDLVAIVMRQSQLNLCNEQHLNQPKRLVMQWKLLKKEKRPKGLFS